MAHSKAENLTLLESEEKIMGDNQRHVIWSAQNENLTGIDIHRQNGKLYISSGRGPSHTSLEGVNLKRLAEVLIKEDERRRTIKFYFNSRRSIVALANESVRCLKQEGEFYRDILSIPAYEVGIGDMLKTSANEYAIVIAKEWI